jgi:hypothetical protein
MQKHTKSIFPGSSLETHLSVDISAEKQDKPCDLQEQRFVAQIVLHPQLMSSINHA